MDVRIMVDADNAIRALIDRCAKGFRDKDIDAIMACHARDVVCFDCHSQFEARGAEAMRAFLDACMPHMQGPVTSEVHDLSIAADGGVGLAHYHMRTGCRGSDGAEHGGWLRVTLGLRRDGGEWLASHAHISAPFNPMTGSTMFGLPRDASAWDNRGEGAGCAAS